MPEPSMRLPQVHASGKSRPTKRKAFDLIRDTSSLSCRNSRFIRKTMLPKKNFGTNYPARDQIIVHPAYCHCLSSPQKLCGFPELREHSILNRTRFLERSRSPWPPRHRLTQTVGTEKSFAALAPRRESIESRFNALDHGCRANIPGPADRRSSATMRINAGLEAQLQAAQSRRGILDRRDR